MVKSRDLDPMLNWGHIVSSRRLKTCPFDVLEWMVRECLNDHDGRRYLALSGEMSLCERYELYYLTPAELDCPARQAFEIGDLTWTEYWESRPHLIRWTNSFLETSYVSTEYAQPREIFQSSPDIFSYLDRRSPFEFKREVMEFRINQDILGKCDSSASEANYREFMKVYERRMGKRVA